MADANKSSEKLDSVSNGDPESTTGTISVPLDDKSNQVDQTEKCESQESGVDSRSDVVDGSVNTAMGASAENPSPGHADGNDHNIGRSQVGENQAKTNDVEKEKGATADATKTDGAVTEENIAIQEKMVDFIHSQNRADLLWKLHCKRMSLAKIVMYTDFNRVFDDQTIVVYPLSLEDLTSGLLLPYMERTGCFDVKFKGIKDADGKTVYQGACLLIVQRKSETKEILSKLQNLRPDLQATIAETFHRGKSSSSLGESSQEVVRDADLVDSKQTNIESYIRIMKRNPPVAHNLTLFSSMISNNVTEDELWQLFPNARFILFTKEKNDKSPRLYVNFDDEEVLQRSMEAASCHTLSIPPFLVCRLENALLSYAEHVKGGKIVEKQGQAPSLSTLSKRARRRLNKRQKKLLQDGDDGQVMDQKHLLSETKAKEAVLTPAKLDVPTKATPNQPRQQQKGHRDQAPPPSDVGGPSNAQTSQSQEVKKGQQAVASVPKETANTDLRAPGPASSEPSSDNITGGRQPLSKAVRRRRNVQRLKAKIGKMEELHKQDMIAAQRPQGEETTAKAVTDTGETGQAPTISRGANRRRAKRERKRKMAESQNNEGTPSLTKPSPGPKSPKGQKRKGLPSDDTNPTDRRQAKRQAKDFGKRQNFPHRNSFMGQPSQEIAPGLDLLKTLSTIARSLTAQPPHPQQRGGFPQYNPQGPHGSNVARKAYKKKNKNPMQWQAARDNSGPLGFQSGIQSSDARDPSYNAESFYNDSYTGCSWDQEMEPPQEQFGANDPFWSEKSSGSQMYRGGAQIGESGGNITNTLMRMSTEGSRGNSSSYQGHRPNQNLYSETYGGQNYNTTDYQY